MSAAFLHVAEGLAHFGAPSVFSVISIFPVLLVNVFEFASLSESLSGGCTFVTFIVT